jgi:hypothetical protein
MQPFPERETFLLATRLALPSPRNVVLDRNEDNHAVRITGQKTSTPHFS